MEKINEYMKYDFLSDNTLLSKYKRNTKIPSELLCFLHDEYNINPDYIKGKSKFKFDVLQNKLNNFEQIAAEKIGVFINN